MRFDLAHQHFLSLMLFSTLVDDVPSCASVPLTALGILRGTNGVGVTQALNILFQAPSSMSVFYHRMSSTS